MKKPKIQKPIYIIKADGVYKMKGRNYYKVNDALEAQEAAAKICKQFEKQDNALRTPSHLADLLNEEERYRQKLEKEIKEMYEQMHNISLTAKAEINNQHEALKPKPTNTSKLGHVVESLSSMLEKVNRIENVVIKNDLEIAERIGIARIAENPDHPEAGLNMIELSCLIHSKLNNIENVLIGTFCMVEERL
jgi:hypothetical protein